MILDRLQLRGAGGIVRPHSEITSDYLTRFSRKDKF
jgi:hypothetical protein